ncbi:hypothetical protein AB0F17_35310 [Nonomuraea sp. NPDC026600]|uniref:hypothetical protein n=1 Tax=Nonomuraea sp. NPDC026600 TaxID=3155363 RepID=UPI0033FCAD5F
MRASEHGPVITVSGHVRHTSSPTSTGFGTGPAVADGLHLVCAARLDGYDTFLSGELLLPDGRQVNVRILSFDDLTVLLPRQQVPNWADGQAWNGTLRLRAARKAAVPDDVAEAMRAAGLVEAAYDPAELTHLLTWLAEAADPQLRRQRLTVIVASLAARTTAGSTAEPCDPTGAA